MKVKNTCRILAEEQIQKLGHKIVHTFQIQIHKEEGGGGGDEENGDYDKLGKTVKEMYKSFVFIFSS